MNKYKQGIEINGIEIRTKKTEKEIEQDLLNKFRDILNKDSKNKYGMDGPWAFTLTQDDKFSGNIYGLYIIGTPTIDREEITNAVKKFCLEEDIKTYVSENNDLVIKDKRFDEYHHLQFYPDGYRQIGVFLDKGSIYEDEGELYLSRNFEDRNIKLIPCESVEKKKKRKKTKIDETSKLVSKQNLEQLINIAKNIDHCAGILIGTREEYNNGSPISEIQGVFSLYLEGGCTPQKMSITLDSLKETAHCFADYMNKKGIKEYKIINGFRTRFTTKEIVPCDPLINSSLINSFERELYSKLKSD